MILEPKNPKNAVYSTTICRSGDVKTFKCVLLFDYFPYHCLLPFNFLQDFAIPKDEQGKAARFSFQGKSAELKHGSVVIAAVTGCTNTSNPNVMLGAGIFAKKACELGLEVSCTSHLINIVVQASQLLLMVFFNLFCTFYLYQIRPWIKTNLAPGSGAVTKYLLQRYSINVCDAF